MISYHLILRILNSIIQIVGFRLTHVLWNKGSVLIYQLLI